MTFRRQDGPALCAFPGDAANVPHARPSLLGAGQRGTAIKEKYRARVRARQALVGHGRGLGANR
jgi:hypothetical protein